ncbi:MAG: 2-C-methyl-D-erythritol 4-phosphate cytidylyltransferase [Chloroherpetonaceae bacterium]|nr:2-C-methyl-D-erythritol 4-phosphate cytidylyltransferase [Chloroherpetonaceae bacterium]
MASYAIIAAGGLGTRMQLKPGLSKQFLKINRTPVVIHTLRAFEVCPFISEIAVGISNEGMSSLKSFIKKYDLKKVTVTVLGGNERQDSINNALQALRPKLKENDIIHIHDGARPFILPSDIERINNAAIKSGAAVPATKPKDTLKTIQKEGLFFSETLDRSRIRQVQTPQAFRAELILEAHEKAQSEGFYGTDDATLVEKYFPSALISIVETDYFNIKITTPEDLDFAQAIYKRRQNHKNLLF